VYTLMFMMGICVAHYNLKTIMFFLLSPLILYLLGKTNQKELYRMMYGFFCIGFVLISFAGWQFDHGMLAKYSLDSKSHDISAKVLEISKTDEEEYDITVRTNGERLLCKYYGKIDNPWIMTGKTIHFTAKVDRPSENGNPRCFDYRLYLKSKKIGYITTFSSFKLLGDKPGFIDRAKCCILQKRECFLSAVYTSEETNGFIRGIIFGDTSELSEEEYNDFRKNGTAHVLAVSGLHIGILYRVYRWMNQKLHSKGGAICFIGILLLYGTVTLWSVSVTRAVLLIGFDLAGSTMKRRYDLLTSLSATAMVSMLDNPYVIFDAGFQMSFLAVTSIVFLQKTTERFVGKKLSVSAAVQLGLVPYMAYVFNGVPLIGIICNIPIVYFVSLLVPVGVFGFLFFFFSGMMLPFFPETISALAALTSEINRILSFHGKFFIDVMSPPLWSIILFYCLLFYSTSEYAAVCFHRREWKKVTLHVLAILFLSMAFIFPGRSAFDRASVIFVDVGQGDCLHLKSENRVHVLIDGGGSIRYDTGSKILKPYLLKNGCNKVDLALATHLHTDHYLGLVQLAQCFPVNRLITKGKASSILELNEEQWIEVLWPLEDNPPADDENLNSMIFMIHDQGTKILVTGDITAEGEAMLQEQYRGTDKLKADILKIAHHGSAYSTSDTFLAAVDPEIAVISVGKNNYGHPSNIVIEKLKKKGIMVFRTDLDGAVGIIHGKGNLSVCTEKQR